MPSQSDAREKGLAGTSWGNRTYQTPDLRRHVASHVCKSLDLRLAATSHAKPTTPIYARWSLRSGVLSHHWNALFEDFPDEVSPGAIGQVDRTRRVENEEVCNCPRSDPTAVG